MSNITYEIEAGEYAIAIKYRDNQDHVRLEQGDTTFWIPKNRIKDMIMSLIEIARACDAESVALAKL